MARAEGDRAEQGRADLGLLDGFLSSSPRKMREDGFPETGGTLPSGMAQV
jgi:hypothetical protein